MENEKPPFDVDLKTGDIVPPKFDANALIAERGKARGAFKTVASTAQALKVTLRDADEDAGALHISDVEYEALENIATKIARILHRKTQFDLDSWRDIAGYATLVVDYIQERRAENGEVDF